MAELEAVVRAPPNTDASPTAKTALLVIWLRSEKRCRFIKMPCRGPWLKPELVHALRGVTGHRKNDQKKRPLVDLEFYSCLPSKMGANHPITDRWFWFQENHVYSVRYVSIERFANDERPWQTRPASQRRAWPHPAHQPRWRYNGLHGPAKHRLPPRATPTPLAT